MRVPITSRPSLKRCAVVPGSQESSSAISSVRSSFLCGSPLLPPKLKVVSPWIPSGRSDETSTRAAGRARYAVASRRWRGGEGRGCVAEREWEGGGGGKKGGIR